MSEDNKEQAAENQKPSEEMSEEELKQVAGGGETIALASKSKTADKAFSAMEGYIKG
jgi:lactobin A/cerein 7B family class IIb bacteriocin